MLLSTINDKICTVEQVLAAGYDAYFNSLMKNAKVEFKDKQIKEAEPSPCPLENGLRIENALPQRIMY